MAVSYGNNLPGTIATFHMNRCVTPSNEETTKAAEFIEAIKATCSAYQLQLESDGMSSLVINKYTGAPHDELLKFALSEYIDYLKMSLLGSEIPIRCNCTQIHHKHDYHN